MFNLSGMLWDATTQRLELGGPRLMGSIQFNRRDPHWPLIRDVPWVGSGEEQREAHWGICGGENHT